MPPSFLAMALSCALLLASPPAIATAAESPGYYRAPLSVSTTRDPDPPKYASRAPVKGPANWQGPAWLDLGLDHRIRFEYRHDDIRHPATGTDEPFLHRTRFYAGVHDVLDPFRFALEVADSRRWNSQWPDDSRDVNEWEFIRLYAELHDPDLLGHDPKGHARPAFLRWGIHNFEFLDRRLVANNQWRNTANTFLGFHSSLGAEINDWQLDLLAVQPIARRMHQPDKPIHRQWLFGAIGHWRRWSDVATLEPFYLALRQSATSSAQEHIVHSPGLRAYGIIGNSGFDWDADVVVQTGRTGDRSLSAFGTTAELGYRFPLPWQPRLSAFYGYASGDRNPNDSSDQRFERFYGFARPWSASEYAAFENISAPKVRLEITPHRKLRIDTGWNWYALASARDRYQPAAVRDPSGRSGRSVGQEFDFRARWQINPHLETILGYAHFSPGSFVSQTIRPDAADFIYLEVNVKAF
jgi:hypothetical protein